MRNPQRFLAFAICLVVIAGIIKLYMWAAEYMNWPHFLRWAVLIGSTIIGASNQAIAATMQKKKQKGER